ncbi:PREDICTED: uncharacterized protein LOC108559655 [Nicrophorus vespilloides]|uniref:Gustatory receptor n=1 Tax=Nicrophorus vespilloides TaxID=110193 RepID=A0ABM1MD43_NICVS|nr:PREDICTED: uncharacterized protein LOC108559655 [Nicrophorus vespilloides]
MAYIDRKHDVTFLKKIYRVGNFFGICPIYSFEHKELIFRRAYNVYLLIACVAYVIGTYCSMYETYQHALVKMKFLQIVTAAPTTLSLNIHPLINVIQILITDKLWEDLLRGLQNVDRSFRGLVQRKKRSYYLLEVVSSHLLICYISFGMVTFRLLNGRLPDYETMNAICRYVLYVRCILIYNFAVCLGHRFEILAENLASIDNAFGVYSKLCDLIETFNRLFGLDMLLFFADMLLCFVLFINLLLYPFRKKTPWEISIQTIRIIHSFFTLVTLTGITWACERATANASGISLVAVKLIQARSQERTKLRLLYLRLKSRPKFTVWGLFELNSSNLLGSFGTLVSYLILALNTK